MLPVQALTLSLCAVPLQVSDQASSQPVGRVAPASEPASGVIVQTADSADEFMVHRSVNGHDGRALGGNVSAPPSPSVGQQLPRTRSLQALDQVRRSAPVKAIHPGIEKSVFDRVQSALLPRQIVALEKVQAGLSGTMALRAEDSMGDAFFVKVVTDWDQVAKPEEFVDEARNARTASEQGFGPRVVASDMVDGLIAFEMLQNDMADGSKGGVEPRLSATLRTMHALHASKPGDACRGESMASTKGLFEHHIRQLSDSDRTDEGVVEARALIDLCAKRLAQMNYVAAPRHGDLHQFNVIFVANEDRAYLVDWGSANNGDPMQELAYFAYHINVNIGGLPRLALLYGGLDADELLRAQLHLAVMPAERYVQTAHGKAPWDRPESRPSKLKKHRAWMREDSALLGNESI